MDEEQIGHDAGETARQKTVRLLQERASTKIERVLVRLGQALSAKETKFFQHEGRVTDHRKVIAHGTRLRAVDLALQLHDVKPSEKHDLKVTGDLTVIVKKYDWEDDTNSPEEA